MNKPWARRAIGAGIALAVGIAMTGCAASGGSSGRRRLGRRRVHRPGRRDHLLARMDRRRRTGDRAQADRGVQLRARQHHGEGRAAGVGRHRRQDAAGDQGRQGPRRRRAARRRPRHLCGAEPSAGRATRIVDGLGYTADDFPPEVFDKGNYDGAQYAVPWSVTPLGLYVNKTVLAEAGITEIPTDQESYIAALEALKGVGVPGRVGRRLRLHRHVRVREPDLAVRRRALQRGRHRGHVQLRSRREGADLDDRPGRRRLQPAERGAGRQHQGPDRRRDRLQLERRVADHEHRVRRPRLGGGSGSADRQRAGRVVQLDALGVPGEQGSGQGQDRRRSRVRQVDERQLARMGRDGRAPRRQHRARRPVAARAVPEPRAVHGRAASTRTTRRSRRASARRTRRSPSR